MPSKSLVLLLVICSIIKINSLDNGLAITPPMGWLSWERFRCLIDCELYPDECLSEDLIKAQADRMVEDGFLEAGYEYIIIDDCWPSKSRDSDGRLQADPNRFPNGIKALADYVHDRGLKLGIYGDYGTLTCGGYPGSIDYLQLDAQTFADWGVDYLKLDGCYADIEGMEKGYGEMAEYLNETGRPIVFSCSFPAYQELDANYSAAVQFCNLWRNYGDIQDTWDDIIDISNWFGENQDLLRQYAGPGHWNDPDMLIIGNFGLSLEQSKSQMAIWSVLAAPLIMSTDLRTIGSEFREILLNRDAIRINQDEAGIPGERISTNNDIQVWRKPLTSKAGNCESLAFAVVSFRQDGYKYIKTLTESDLGLGGNASYTVKNVFEQQFEDIISGENYEITLRIPPSGGVLLLIEPTQCS